MALGAPAHYPTLLGALPTGARLTARLPSGGAVLHFLHCFFTTRRALASRFSLLARRLASDGTLWISWPKRGSAVATDLTENVVREVGLTHGLVDVKVCAVDATWSALKFVRRLADRS